MRASRPFRGTRIELLRDPENAALYLEEALAAGDVDAFKLVLRNVAEARLVCYGPLDRSRRAGETMTGGTATQAKAELDLFERIAELARETGSTPDEIEAAVREYAEYERWKEAMVQEALDELKAGGPTYSHEEVMSWFKGWGTDDELPPPGPATGS